MGPCWMAEAAPLVTYEMLMKEKFGPLYGPPRPPTAEEERKIKAEDAKAAARKAEWYRQREIERDRRVAVMAPRVAQNARFTQAARGRRGKLVLGLRRSGLTLKQVGDLAGVSRERIRQIEAKEKRLERRRLFVQKGARRAYESPPSKVNATQPGDRDFEHHVWTPEMQYAEFAR